MLKMFVTHTTRDTHIKRKALINVCISASPPTYCIFSYTWNKLGTQLLTLSNLAVKPKWLWQVILEWGSSGFL